MIYQLLWNHLQSTPYDLALVTSQGDSLTYSMLAKRVNQWATYFLNQSIQSGDRVAVLLDNEDHHYFILLALDRINATYVPFDTDIPKEQLLLDIEALDLKKFIIEDSLTATFDIPLSLRFTLSAEIFADIFASSDIEPSLSYQSHNQEKILYIVSSSGSTGHKTWIPILGEGLGYWNHVIQDVLAKNPIQKMLATRSPAYDARIFEYLCALSSNGTLYLLNRKQRKDFQSILETCKNASITSLLLIASQVGHYNTESIVSILKQNGVRHLMVTGDACTLRLKQLCEQYDIQLLNCYGPTEATFGLSMLSVNHIETYDTNGDAIVPIGKPHGDEVRYHLIEGKLFIESPYLTPGYLHDNNATSFKLITQENGKTVRLFDTGDLFSEHDRYIFYHGRYDKIEGHCKINGVKIMPSYIERCIHDYNSTHPHSSIQAAVVIKPYLGTHKPVAYLVASENVDKLDLLSYLKHRLKKEECPILMKSDGFPILLPSQKIDRQALIARQDQPRDLFLGTEVGSTASDNYLQAHYESVIATIWRELLKLECDVAHDTEFLWLGGTSIMEAEMAVKIKDTIDSSFSHIQLQELPAISIRAIADSLLRKHKAAQHAVGNDPMTHALIKPLTRSMPSFRGVIFFLPALLGEGYYSYKNLANSMLCHSAYKDYLIYGLSDPGTLHIEWLPKSLEHAATRYINAIKTIQPKGPYQLLGFSFGATLAYAVAKALLNQGDAISDLHLIDGFPPLSYQTMSSKTYTSILQPLFNFIIPILNNRYYGESLEPLSLNNVEQLSKQEQIEIAFTSIINQVVNPQSRNVLALAKSHLLILLNENIPQAKLPLWPTFYLTDMAQHYQRAMTKESSDSADYHYHYWNRYVEHITRSGLQFNGEHLSVLATSTQPRLKSQRAEFFWSRSHEPFYNRKIDFYGPCMLYRLVPLNQDRQFLHIFFSNQDHAQLLAEKLLQIEGAQVKKIVHDKNIYRQEANAQGDEVYSYQTNLFCEFPVAQTALVTQIMKAESIAYSAGIALPPVPRSDAWETTQALIKIDISLTWEEKCLLTLSFQVNGESSDIQQAIYQTLYIKPVTISTDQVNTTYQHEVVMTSTSVYDAIRQGAEFLADFIEILEPYIAQSNSVEEKWENSCKCLTTTRLSRVVNS